MSNLKTKNKMGGRQNYPEFRNYGIRGSQSHEKVIRASHLFKGTQNDYYIKDWEESGYVITIETKDGSRITIFGKNITEIKKDPDCEGGMITVAKGEDETKVNVYRRHIGIDSSGCAVQATVV